MLSKETNKQTNKMKVMMQSYFLLVLMFCGIRFAQIIKMKTILNTKVLFKYIFKNRLKGGQDISINLMKRLLGNPHIKKQKNHGTC